MTALADVAISHREMRDEREDYARATARFHAAVRCAYTEGHKLAVIARSCGLTVQRVSQIVDR